MPLVKMQTSVSIAEEKRNEILLAASHIVAEATGKPEMYVMVTIEEGVFLMGGKSGPAAFVDVRGIGGLTPEVNKRLSESLCSLLKEKLSIEPERVYVNFTDVSPTNWGWNSGTFG